MRKFATHPCIRACIPSALIQWDLISSVSIVATSCLSHQTYGSNTPSCMFRAFFCLLQQVHNPHVAGALESLVQRHVRRGAKHESNPTSQDAWNANNPRAKFVLADHDTMHPVGCLMCTRIEGIHKLWVPNLDSLYKHGMQGKPRSMWLVVLLVQAHSFCTCTFTYAMRIANAR